MSRTTAEIKKTMTDAFMADASLREIYKLTPDATWASSFSAVSIENILFFIVAACMRVMEVIFDQYKKDVDDKIADAIVATVPWYHKKALEFQLGDSLVIDPDTYEYGYAKPDESKQVVKYAAVRDYGSSIRILVSGDTDGKPSVLSNEVLTPFKYYINRIKLAGTIVYCNSYASDKVIVNADIQVDPLIIDDKGYQIGKTVKPVEEAIELHLRDILYGGTLNTTRLVDAIQAVEGVVDVRLNYVEVKAAEASSWTRLTGNNYEGVSGSYVTNNLSQNLAYVV